MNSTEPNTRKKKRNETFVACQLFSILLNINLFREHTRSAQNPAPKKTTTKNINKRNIENSSTTDGDDKSIEDERNKPAIDRVRAYASAPVEQRNLCDTMCSTRRMHRPHSHSPNAIETERTYERTKERQLKKRRSRSGSGSGSSSSSRS